jgi:molecular chaperone HtpG
MSDPNQETHAYQTEVKQLLDLMIHSLYSNKEIFLRELISNASDAADKLRFEALSDDSLFEGEGDLRIRLEFDEQARTISVTDNGIGMTRDEVVDNIGTIARSGTKHFFENLTGDEAKDAELIGQFGVGFYSTFIVADSVTVETRRAGHAIDTGVRWSSSGDGEYTIETIDLAQRGTRVTLVLREGEDEFLNAFRLRNIIGKYSDHISIPIEMRTQAPPTDASEDDAEPVEAPEFEMVNKATALWSRNKSEISDEEYEEFYKNVAHDFDGPLETIHNRVEGNLEYTALLFLPKHAPFDLWDRNVRRGVKLYVRRVFIMDDAEQLMPAYLRFVRGVIDTNDLPLNVSREILQQNKKIDSIRSGCVRRVLSSLSRMAENEAEKYATVWGEFGRVLKEGVIEDDGNRNDVAKLLRYASSTSEADDATTSLADYLARMKEGQDSIYFITGDNYATVRNSPHLEIFKKKGIEVLLMVDEIDEWVVNHLTEFEGKALRSVTKGELSLDDVDNDAKSADDAADGAEDGESGDSSNGIDDPQFDSMIEKMTEALGERVKSVRLTRRLTESAACLVAEEHELGSHLEKVLKAAGQDVPRGKPILEINPEHPIVKWMSQADESEMFEDLAHVLHDQALLSEGSQLDDPSSFVRRLNGLLQTMTA